jgi:hypothetical protein
MTQTADSPAPRHLEDVLDPSWLSGALGASYRGCRVHDATIVETQRTIATKTRFTISYDNPGDPPAPDALCVKGYFHEEGWRRPGAGEVEAQFYRNAASMVGARVAHSVYVGIDQKTRSAVVIMQDLVAAGATFLTALSPYTVDQTAATLDQLALLHATNWDSPLLREDWLRPKMELIASSMPTPRLQELLDRPRAETLPSRVRRADRLHAGLAALIERDVDPLCLIHGDVHAGNVFETAEGPGLIDWQLVQRGPWAADVAYHIGAVLAIEDRRRYEDTLLAHYLDRLGTYGVKCPSREEATDAYRMYLVYGMFLWSMTQFVDEPITTQFVRRLGQAVADHGSFELLGV